MTTLTGFGGVGEIGGNAFLLDDGKSRLFLDFGRRFGNDPDDDAGTGHLLPGWGDFFDDYLQPRGYCKTRDLARLGVIPDMPAAYRVDLGGEPGDAGLDGVILSHAHADHAGLIPFLKPEVPVFGSAESWATLRSLQETGSGADVEYIEAKPKGLGRTAKGTVSGSARFPEGRQRDLVSDECMRVGDWDISQYAVDHSIHGARGTILAGRDVTIAYTGDFRINGRDADATAKFLERAGGSDIIITEGTNVGQSHKHEGSDKEVEVEGDIEAAIDAQGDGFVGIAAPPRDLDRFISIWNVARRAGRRLVITTKQAHLLDSLRAAGRDDLPDPRTDASVAVHLRGRGKGVLTGDPAATRVFAADLSFEDVGLDDKQWRDLARRDFATWERPYFDSGNAITSADLGAELSGHIFSVSYWSITELLDIFPRRADAGGLYIHSMTQPFNDEMHITGRKLDRWLSAFNLERADTHISGHLSEQDLHWAIDEVGAKALVPIHSLHPSITADKYHARTGGKAIIPQYGQAIALGR